MAREQAVAELHVRIYGTVQGVGFRWFVRQRARVLGLSGFVRNCDDGAVLVEARGALDRLDALESALRTGPAGALVSEVMREPVEDPSTDRLAMPFEIQR